MRISQRPDPPGKVAAIDGGVIVREARGEAERVGVEAEHALGGAREQPLAGAVDQPQPALGIEREHRDVDLLHHGAQEARRLERAHALRRAACRRAR